MKKIILPVLLSTTIMVSACQTSGTGTQNNSDWLWSATQSVLGSVVSQQSIGSQALSSLDISNGLKETLQIATDTVVKQLGHEGGFSADPAIRILLPEQIQKIDNTLNKFGLGSVTNNLKAKMNEAAEIATPKAKELFIHAITNMTMDDARSILNGPNDAATSFLRRTTGQKLSNDMKPIVETALNEAGAIQLYDKIVNNNAVLKVFDLKADINDYVLDKTMDGIFYYVAQEEAAIRHDPAKRTTELIKKIFSKNGR